MIILPNGSLAVLLHLQAHLDEAGVEAVDVEMALAEVGCVMKIYSFVPDLECIILLFRAFSSLFKLTNLSFSLLQVE